MPTRISFLGVTVQDSPVVRGRILMAGLATLALLVVVEWFLRADVSLGILYSIPVAIAAVVLNRKQVLLMAVVAALLRGQFTAHDSTIEWSARFLMATLAYAACGLLVVEVSNNRRRLVEHLARLNFEQQLRQKVEDQLRILVESSPAAILTLDSKANVAAANRAAHEMFGFTPDGMLGVPVEPLFPVFARALEISPDRHVRSSVSGWGRHREGSTFPVQAWFSTYGSGPERALAAILVDMSEEVRDRERENFRQLVDHHRLLAGAVSHEIRNLCSAASVVCANLSKSHELGANADFEALRNLVAGLTRIASVELRRDESPLVVANLRQVLDQWRVVVEPDWTDVGGRIDVQYPAELPEALADPHGVLQIFLNLAQNSCRAVAAAAQRELRITASCADEQIVVQFEDTGHGIQDRSILFHPFREEADGTGLGLYVSRALARSYGGDLVHVPTERGCRFDVLLLPSGATAP
jgi:PAS domain S-box-containing protein